MQLKWFQVKNFRSIKDSGICYVSEDITILAGKNESGKTNILTAMSFFDLQKEFSEDDYNLYNEQKDEPEILMSFSLNEEEWDEISDKLQRFFTPTNEVIFSKKGHEKGYSIDFIETNIHEITGTVLWKAILGVKETIEKYNKYCTENNLALFTEENYSTLDYKEIKTLRNANTISIPISDDSLSLLKQHLQAHYNSVSPLLQNLNNNSVFTETYKSLEQILSDLIEHFVDVNKLKLELVSRIPKIVYFSSFEDILPFEVPFANINSKIIQDFCKVVGLDYKILNTQNNRELIQQINSASTTLQGDFGSFWSQEEIRIECQVVRNNLVFPIYDKGKNIAFKMEQRSKGLQWFISFYLTLNATNDENILILIDEPGLYLHAKAQQDLLKILEKLSKNHQIVFSTHMPYLIDINKLDRIRLILKDDKNKLTTVENKVHKIADFETLTPIITAIGLDITRSLQLANNKNVIVEGITDYYYLNHMKALLADELDCPESDSYSIIPSMGADKIPVLSSLMIGWDLNFVIVLDNDKEGKRVGKNLVKKFFDNIIILFITDEENSSIEDLFSKKDFQSLIKTINTQIDFPDELLNSQIIKELQLNKYEIARKLIETKTKKSDFEKETIENFLCLLNKISKALEECNN